MYIIEVVICQRSVSRGRCIGGCLGKRRQSGGRPQRCIGIVVVLVPIVVVLCNFNFNLDNEGEMIFLITTKVIILPEGLLADERSPRNDSAASSVIIVLYAFQIKN